MMSENEVSIIMSVYNNADKVSKAIESILNQTFKDFRFLILDDGSTDGSFEILNKYKSLDNRVEIYQNKHNIGLTMSLNKLISYCNSKYIARQDADDISLENRLKAQLKTIKNSDYSLVTSRAICEKRIIPRFSYYLPNKITAKYKNPFIHGTFFTSKSVLETVGNYDEKFYYAQDYKLVSDLIKKRHKIKIMKEPLYILNMVNNISQNKKIEQKYYADCVKSGKTPDLKVK
jgi:glycosyltransferase involved in cell wall biosynthesis